MNTDGKRRIPGLVQAADACILLENGSAETVEECSDVLLRKTWSPSVRAKSNLSSSDRQRATSKPCREDKRAVAEPLAAKTIPS